MRTTFTRACLVTVSIVCGGAWGISRLRAEQTETAAGAEAARAMPDTLLADVARSVGKSDPPNWQYYVTLADGTESRGREIRETEWDWAHAEGCRAGR